MNNKINKKYLLSGLALACLSSLVQAETFQFNSSSTMADTLVLFQSGTQAAYQQTQLPSQTQALLQQAAIDNQFSGQTGQILELVAPIGVDAKRILLVGVGQGAQLTPAEINLLGGKFAQRVEALTQPSISLYLNGMPNANEFAAQFAHGVELNTYRYSRYTERPRLEKTYQFSVADNDKAEQRYQQLAAVAAGVYLARDLTNDTPVDLYPQSFATAAQELTELGVKVTVLDEQQMQKLNMGALLGVGMGSKRPPRLVIAHWQGSDDTPIALVGKGITFDSGGYNIKATGTTMSRMKSDMAGAATVLGTVKAMAQQQAPLNVVAIMAMAENMVSGDALRPGDVLTTAKGLTVEVLNTDAEGRLVLADALWYADNYYQPDIIVDVATLTGSKVRALGREYAGLFSDDITLVDELTYAGEQVGEKVWRLPLHQAYGAELKSAIADLTNTGSSSSAGASSAAMFLQRFAGESRWAHIDIAGNSLGKATPLMPEGATGYGVRLLSHWLMDKADR
ncbi:leucyl aminopeptidase [Shewanella marina]|uniref:leucyl aminopeptidase n=1 Tax=Shewanella marina TaxID=487319 RepID=UPI000470A9EB|nr:leucyl aminopeptidase [Shewanella marina]